MERAQTYNTLWDLGPSFQSLPALKVRIFKFQQNGNNFYFLVNTLFHEIKVFLNCTSKSCIKIVHQNTGLVSNRASVTSWGKGASLALVILLIMCVPLPSCPLSAGSLNLLPNFQKGGLDRTSTLRGGLLEKRG